MGEVGIEGFAGYARTFESNEIGDMRGGAEGSPGYPKDKDEEIWLSDT